MILLANMHAIAVMNRANLVTSLKYVTDHSVHLVFVKSLLNFINKQILISF
jgi:hypothetical protein